MPVRYVVRILGFVFSPLIGLVILYCCVCPIVFNPSIWPKLGAGECFTCIGCVLLGVFCAVYPNKLLFSWSRASDEKAKRKNMKDYDVWAFVTVICVAFVGATIPLAEKSKEWSLERKQQRQELLAQQEEELKASGAKAYRCSNCRHVYYGSGKFVNVGQRCDECGKFLDKSNVR